MKKIKAIYCVNNPPTKRLKSRRYYKCKCDSDYCSMAVMAVFDKLRELAK